MQPEVARSQTIITDRDSLRKYLIEEESGLLTGFISARMESDQDKRVLLSCVGAFQEMQDATVNAFLDLLLAKFRAAG